MEVRPISGPIQVGIVLAATVFITLVTAIALLRGVLPIVGGDLPWVAGAAVVAGVVVAVIEARTQ
jgi:hypothetical protein